MPCVLLQNSSSAVGGCGAKQRHIQQHLRGTFQNDDEDKFLVATLEAALEYIRSGGLSQQKYVTRKKSGTLEIKRKRPLFAWSQIQKNVPRSSSLLLTLFQLIENEDVESIRVLFSKGRLSCELLPHLQQKSDTDAKESTITSKQINDIKKEVDCSSRDNLIIANRGIRVSDNQTSSSNAISGAIEAVHECHPLCTCDTEKSTISVTSQSDIRKCYLPSIPASVILQGRDELGRSPLHLASLLGNPLMVELLITHYDEGSSGLGLYSISSAINCKDAYGMSPIHCAAMKGHQNVLLLLLHADADRNALDDEKNSPLHLAANNGHDACVKALIYYSEHQSCPLNLNATNFVGDTPLHMAAKWGFLNIVQILLSYDAR